MSATLFQNASILDGRIDEALADHHVLVEDKTDPRGFLRGESRRPRPARSTSRAAPSCPA